jgi:hypothetical protein
LRGVLVGGFGCSVREDFDARGICGNGGTGRVPPDLPGATVSSVAGTGIEKIAVSLEKVVAFPHIKALVFAVECIAELH